MSWRGYSIYKDFGYFSFSLSISLKGGSWRAGRVYEAYSLPMAKRDGALLGTDKYSWELLQAFCHSLGRKSSELQLLATFHSAVHVCGWSRYSYVHILYSDITDLSVSCGGTQSRGPKNLQDT